MNKDYYVYEYVRLDNNSVFYVGKGKGNRIDRMYNRPQHFTNIINSDIPIAKYIVCDNLTEEQAHGIECMLIHQYVFEEGYSINIKGFEKNKDKFHLTNQTWGGEGTSGFKFSEESRKKMSESLKGENHPNYGKKLSEEHKLKLIKSHKDKKLNETTKFKISQSLKGKRHSEETRKKMSENNAKPMLDKFHSKETRKKMSEKAKLRVKELNPMYNKKGSLHPTSKIAIVEIDNIIYIKKTYSEMIDFITNELGFTGVYSWFIKGRGVPQKHKDRVSLVMTQTKDKTKSTIYHMNQNCTYKF